MRGGLNIEMISEAGGLTTEAIQGVLSLSTVVLSLSTVVLKGLVRNCTASGKFRALKINLAIGFTRKNLLECIGKAIMMLYLG